LNRKNDDARWFRKILLLSGNIRTGDNKKKYTVIHAIRCYCGDGELKGTRISNVK
jgi:hypothetical protein